MKIENKVALVAGGASGMGAQTCKHLAKQGAKVIVLDINQDAALKTAQEIDGVGFACDITSATALEQVFDDIKSKMKQAISIAINCAGVAPGKRIVGKEGAMPLDWFKKVIDINLNGTFNVMRLCAENMMNAPLDQDERGIIINTASIAAYEGQIGQAAYSASKGGVVAMTLPAARELAQFGIRVVCVAPGLIDTPMMSGMSDKVRENLIAQTVFPKRLGYAQEYAELVAHIIQNPLMNGDVIRLDGAVRMV